MDTFVEQIVKKKLGPKDFAIMIGLTAAVVALLYISLVYLFPISGAIGFFVIVGACYGYYRLITTRNLEFEYSFTNGDLTIDKIINRQRRKRVISFDVKAVEELGPFDAAKMANKSFEKKYFVGIEDSGKDCWYLDCRGEKTGHVLVVFQPEERMLNAMRPFLQRQVRVNAFGR